MCGKITFKTRTSYKSIFKIERVVLEIARSNIQTLQLYNISKNSMNNQHKRDVIRNKQPICIIN